jgi:hypothetical protein
MRKKIDTCLSMSATFFLSKIVFKYWKLLSIFVFLAEMAKKLSHAVVPINIKVILKAEGNLRLF